MKKLIPQKLKNIYHLINAISANIWYGFPSRKLEVVGVTGTNGKTTTVEMIAKIFEIAGKKVAASSTIKFKLGDKEEVNKTKFTTLSAWQMQKFAKKAVDAKCDYLVLEVSSHSLDQNRIWGINFDVAVITNVTREHLDYHHTMNEYRRAKAKLFTKLRENGIAVVNLDMKDSCEFVDAVNWGQKQGFFYGYTTRENQKLKIKNQNKLKIIGANSIEINQQKSMFIVDGVKFQLNLIGEFNIENALAAICVGLSQNIGLERIANALGEIKNVPGRMDYVKNDKGIDVIIDYALTPDSMEKLGSIISDLNRKKEPNNRQSTIDNRKLIWVFGSCGERDRGKRPIMGEIVSKYADYVIVTNEDPYYENPQKIIDEVCEGIFRSGKKENVDAWKIFDRKKAIKKALKLARQGDIILITGKGAEETMAIRDKRISWNDKKVVKELLQNL